ncbi:peptidylprolyl isomerase [Pseudochryseolinea flava]|uniref:Periplasmic chaperone PpiD n=1 Tax=Pseudochryseolinea flava TaxID=2059302 RepID=A0A364Y8X7_9BACT|nr:peptidylprolyl isomerase [Pseudochryseolinea flava]RAW03400.1 foldase [Pseudochryseolinea flava]
MALIGTLRDKAGIGLVVFVFVAISAFILGDIFSGNSNIMRWGADKVGTIAGKEITKKEFDATVLQMEEQYRQRAQRDPGEREMIGIRQQAWELLIAKYAFQPQFEKVGITVTQEEQLDMIEGVNIEEGLRQAFVNPQTGEFDRAMMQNYISQARSNQNSQEYLRLKMYADNLAPARARIKYENLILKTGYVTKAEAERAYHAQEDVAELKYLYVPFFAISDSAAQVSDSDLKDFYQKNIERFKTEATRDIKYVSVPVVPSAQDSAIVQDKLAKALEAFRTTSNDSAVAYQYSLSNTPFEKYNNGTLPTFINRDSLVEGKVIGPIVDGDSYKIVKVSKVTNDTVSYASARHILITWTDSTDAAKADAKTRANNVLDAIKKGADFAGQASAFSQDQSNAQRGGDLGWFANNGTMVKPFEDAIFGATKAGLLNEVVETQFGYHIIDVTNPKTNRAYQLAIVEEQIIPLDASISAAFTKAEALATASDVEDFEAKAKEQGLTVLEAKSIRASDRGVSSLGEARAVVQWLYREAKTDKVSQVFELEGQNVVAVMTGEIKKGHRPFESVKNEITPEVQKIVKGKAIAAKLNGLKGTLDEIAAGFGKEATVYTSSNVRLSGNGLPPAVNYDPVAVGVSFSLENGKRSQPFNGENGVLIVELQNKTVAPAIENYTPYSQQLLQSLNMAGYSISEAIKEKSDIEDERYKFN